MRNLTGTIIWGVVAAGVGIGLFFIKHEVKEQEARLAELNREIQRNQEAIHVLKAEWSYLNDPARLRALAERHLAMAPMAPAQVATLDSLPRDTGPALAAEPAALAPAALAPAALAKVEAPVPVKPPKAEPVTIAKPTPVKIAKAEPVKFVKAEPARLARPAPAAVPQTPPAPPRGRVIVIQSPALAASDFATSGEAR